MTSKLDQMAGQSVSDDVMQFLEDQGYGYAEAIAGLIDAVVKIADGDDQLLDEAANLLADGGIIDTYEGPDDFGD